MFSFYSFYIKYSNLTKDYLLINITIDCLKHDNFANVIKKIVNHKITTLYTAVSFLKYLPQLIRKTTLTWIEPEKEVQRDKNIRKKLPGNDNLHQPVSINLPSDIQQ
ncbi:MAG TPA: hypothetical protein DF818_05880 [Bacteroidales bacterium]|nr:hypothetical protein [Bacteroidales bacterium]